MLAVIKGFSSLVYGTTIAPSDMDVLFNWSSQYVWDFLMANYYELSELVEHLEKIGC